MQPEEPESCTRVLVDGSLATTMCDNGVCPLNEEGKDGALTAAERDDMAKFLLSVPYPPAQRRSYTNVLSSEAQTGFEAFSHRMVICREILSPMSAVTVIACRFGSAPTRLGTGMEAPTWRGAYDRWLILPQGRLNLIDFDFYRRITDRGDSRTQRVAGSRGLPAARFDPVWDMVLEGSTGFSGSFARQVTLNQASPPVPPWRATCSTPWSRPLP